MKFVSQETKDQVLQYIRDNPEISKTKIAEKFGVCRHSIYAWTGTYNRNSELRKVWQKEKSDKAKHVLIQFLGGGCYECGYRDCEDALDFHHRDQSQKLRAISNILTGNFDKLVAEASKCILLCSRCHREHHSENGSLGPNQR